MILLWESDQPNRCINWQKITISSRKNEDKNNQMFNVYTYCIISMFQFNILRTTNATYSLGSKRMDELSDWWKKI